MKKLASIAFMAAVAITSPAMGQHAYPAEYSDNPFTAYFQRIGDRIKDDLGFYDWSRASFWFAAAILAVAVFCVGAWIWRKILDHDEYNAEMRKAKIRRKVQQDLDNRR